MFRHNTVGIYVRVFCRKNIKIVRRLFKNSELEDMNRAQKIQDIYKEWICSSPDYPDINPREPKLCSYTGARDSGFRILVKVAMINCKPRIYTRAINIPSSSNNLRSRIFMPANLFVRNSHVK